LLLLPTCGSTIINNSRRFPARRFPAIGYDLSTNHIEIDQWTQQQLKRVPVPRETTASARLDEAPVQLLLVEGQWPNRFPCLP
jgi:hypothetical protein